MIVSARLGASPDRHRVGWAWHDLTNTLRLAHNAARRRRSDPVRIQMKLIGTRMTPIRPIAKRTAVNDREIPGQDGHTAALADVSIDRRRSDSIAYTIELGIRRPNNAE